MPKTRVEFWADKFDRNVERDREKEQALVDAGWRVLTIWECELAQDQLVKQRLERSVAAVDNVVAHRDGRQAS